MVKRLSATGTASLPLVGPADVVTVASIHTNSNSPLTPKSSVSATNLIASAVKLIDHGGGLLTITLESVEQGTGIPPE